MYSPSGEIEREPDDLLVGKLLVPVVVHQGLERAAVLELDHDNAALVRPEGARPLLGDLQMRRPHRRAHELHAVGKLIFSDDIQALFSWQNFSFLATVALSFLFDKHCPITEQLGSKDSSHKFQVNCVISFYFYLYLMLHACD